MCFLFYLFGGCNKTKDIAENNEQIDIDKDIEPIVVDFIKKDFCKECLYEMYIDKKNPHLYEIMLYKGHKSLTFEENSTNKQAPLFYAKILDKRIDIYSGVEHFFKRRKQQDFVDKKTNLFKDFDLWIITDSLGYKKVEITSFAYPFLPKPSKKKIEFIN